MRNHVVADAIAVGEDANDARTRVRLSTWIGALATGGLPVVAPRGCRLGIGEEWIFPLAMVSMSRRTIRRVGRSSDSPDGKRPCAVVELGKLLTCFEKQAN